MAKAKKNRTDLAAERYNIPADDDSHQRKRQQSRDLLGHHQCRDDQECHNDQNAL